MATILWTILGTVFTSHFYRFDAPTLSLWWVIGCIISIFVIIWRKGFQKFTNTPTEHISPVRSRRPWDVKLTMAICVGALAITAVLAAFCAPNNVDSLIYHLPRQVFWMSQKSVFLQFAPHEFHLKMPPLAEYLQANLFLLGGNDSLLNLVQWTSLFLSACLLTLIVEKLGGNERQQLLAAAFFLTLPAAFFQASSTKNDLVLCVFLLLILWIGVSFAKGKRMTYSGCILGGIAAGCALLAKGTALVYLPSLALFLFVVFIVNHIKWNIGGILVAFFLAAVIAAPHWISMSSRIVSAETGSGAQHANAEFALRSALSVFSRNVAVQMAMPAREINNRIENATLLFHKLLNYPINDPKTTFAGTDFRVNFRPKYEDEATSALHFIFLIAMPILSLIFARNRVDVLFLSFLPLLSMIVFSAMLRWQPWHSRLLIPCVAFAGISFGVLFGSNRLKLFGVAAISAMTLWLFPSFDNAHRSLFGGYSVFAKSAAQQRAGYSAEMELGVRVLSDVASAIRPSSVLVDQSVLYPYLLALRFPDGSWPNFVRNLDESPTLVIGNSFSADLMGSSGFISLLSNRGITVWVKESYAQKLKSKVVFASFPNERGVSKIYSTGNKNHPVFFRTLYFPTASFFLPPSSEKRTFEIGIAFLENDTICRILCDDQEIKILDGRTGLHTTTIDIPLGASSILFCFENGRHAKNMETQPAARLFFLHEK